MSRVRVTGDALSRPIFWTGLQWAVTSYGVEKLDGTYPIEAKRLWEDNGGQWTWEDQLEEKGWCLMGDFVKAMSFAREHFKHLKP